MLDFLGLKKSIESIGAEARTLAGKIEAAKRERERLLDAPLPKADYLDMLDACIDMHADDAVEKLKQATAPSVNGYSESLDVPLLSLNGQMGRAAHVFPGPIYLLFREAIKEALRREIETWTWPADVGPPRAARPTMIAKLDKEIAKLEIEEAEIRQAANEAGVNLTGLSAVPAKRKH